MPEAGRRAMRAMASVGDADIKFMDLAGSNFDSVFEHLRVEMAVVRH